MQHNTTPTNEQEKMLIEKIRTLSPEKISQIIDFADFLSKQDNEHRLTQAAKKLTEPTVKKVWDNSEDDVYDNL